MAAHNIGYFLDSSDSLRALARAARGILQLQQVYAQVAPASLAHACHVKLLREGTLFLAAENGAIAAKLKQLTPRLLAAYQKSGFEVTSIHYEVQVSESAHRVTSNSNLRKLSIESIEKLENFAAGLEDAPLKQALSSLAAHQREKSK